jgi:hypothetical protein
VFDRFEVDTLPDGKILVLPYLREDLVDRYADPDGYLRVITSQGVSHMVSDAPPSAGPLLVLDELVTTAPSACAPKAFAAEADYGPLTSEKVQVEV